VRQIDGQLEAGNFARADELLDMAQAEFADDTELVELRGLARQGKERTARADELVTEGQQLCAQGQFEQGVDLLKIALQLDDRTGVRQVLRDLFVARAQDSLNTDWRTVEAFADRALELDANHALARSLRAQALDRKREEEIPQLASQARRLQAAGDFTGALAEVEKGLAAYPGDARLSAIAEVLRKELKRVAAAPPAVVDDGLEAATAPPAVLDAASAATVVQSPAHAPATDVERTRLVLDRRATQPPPPTPAETAEKEQPAQTPTIVPAAPVRVPAAPAPSSSAAARAPRRSPWKLIAGATVAVLVVALVAVLSRRGPASGPPATGDDQPQPVAADPAPEVQQPPPVTAPEQTPSAPALVALTLERLPAGLQVSIDGVSIGTVGANGQLSYPGVSPGPHKLSFVMAGYEPLTIERTFAGPETVALSLNDVPLKRIAAGLELMADAGTQITISQGGRMIQRVTGPSKLSIPEGTYNVEATGPAGVPVTRNVSITSGATQALDVRTIIVSGMELFDLSGWKRDENWFTRRGGGFALYSRSIGDSRYTFTVRLDRNGNPFSTASRLKWVVGYVDNNTHVMMQLDKDALYRLDVVGGTSQQVRVPHRIPTNVPFVHLNVQVSGARLIHQYSVDGSNWQQLDSWTRTPSGPDGGRRTPLDGRFGFFLQGDEDVFVSNFLNHPETH
jgi:tetratricopeptide (TPR) repeat protein